MIDPEARLTSYLRLMAFVLALGVICALMTAAFLAIVGKGTALIWEQVAAAMGLDPRSSPSRSARSAAWWSDCW